MRTMTLVWSCYVFSKFHYTDLQTLSATRPDPRTKSVHVVIDRTGLRPDKVCGLVGDQSEPGRVALVEFGHKIQSGQLQSELFGRRHSTLQWHGLFALAKCLLLYLGPHLTRQDFFTLKSISKK